MEMWILVVLISAGGGAEIPKFAYQGEYFSEERCQRGGEAISAALARVVNKDGFNRVKVAFACTSKGRPA